MSSKLLPPKLELSPTKSRYALIWFAIVAILAGAGCLFLPIPALLRGLLAMLLVTVVVLQASRYWRESSAAEPCCEYRDGCWWLWQDGGWREARLISSAILPFVIVLAFKGDRQQRLVFWSDALPEESQRQLRLILNLIGLSQD